jgi:cell division protein ZapA
VSDGKNTVTVRIAGEEHSLRSNAKPEYTKQCARYVDKRIQEIKQQVGLLEGHKAAILAALSISDELFVAKQEIERLQEASTETFSELAEQLEAGLQ